MGGTLTGHPNALAKALAQLRVADDAGAVVALMREHAASVEVQKEWCVALRSFAEDDDDQTWVASVGGVEAVVQAMQTHAQSAGVQRQGCRALRNLDRKSVV